MTASAYGGCKGVVEEAGSRDGLHSLVAPV